MIIFVYVSSLAHNEPYAAPLRHGLLTLGVAAVTLVFAENREWAFLRRLPLRDQGPHFVVYKAYSFGVYLFTVLLIVYLFVALVAVVKLATSGELPLRAKK